MSILTKVALPEISIYGTRIREEGKLPCIPSFPNSNWQENTVLINIFSPRDSYCFLVLFCMWELGWAALRLGPQQHGQPEIQALCVVRVMLNARPLSLSVLFGNGSGSWEGGIFSSLCGDPSCVSGVARYCQGIFTICPSYNRISESMLLSSSSRTGG